MKKVSHMKKWNKGTVQVHVEPPLIPLIKVRTMKNQIKISLILNCVGI